MYLRKTFGVKGIWKKIIIFFEMFICLPTDDQSVIEYFLKVRVYKILFNGQFSKLGLCKYELLGILYIKYIYIYVLEQTFDFQHIFQRVMQIMIGRVK